MTGGPMHVPNSGGTVCQGFSHGVIARLCCPNGSAAADHFCHFQLSTSDTRILQILDTIQNVPEGTCTGELSLATIGGSAGTVNLNIEDTVSHATGTIGTATVGNQTCL